MFKMQGDLFERMRLISFSQRLHWMPNGTCFKFIIIFGGMLAIRGHDPANELEMKTIKIRNRMRW